MIDQEKLNYMKELNKEMCLDITEIYQDIFRTKKKLQTLEMFYRLKTKEQKSLVRQIFMMEGKTTILPTKKHKKQEVFEKHF